MYLPWIHRQYPVFNIHVCLCWPQMARGIVSCGFGDQDCKLLDFQIKPCEISHCKPSENCWLHYYSFFSSSSSSFTTLKMFTALKQWSVGAGVQAVQPSPVVHIRHPVFELQWRLMGRRGDPRRVLPHHNPFASISATLSGPLGEYSATKAATQNLSLCLVAKGLLLVLSFSSVLSKTDTLRKKK